MNDWKHRPQISDAHLFKEQYDDILDANKDDLLDIIEHYIQMRRAAIELEEKGEKSVYTFLDKKRIDDAIEVYFYKFINKTTKVDDESEKRGL